MARDVVVYTQRATPVAVDEIVDAMRVRGVPVEWRYTLLSERNRPVWTAGSILPEGQSGPQVDVSHEAVEPWLRDEVLPAYADGMSDAHRAAFMNARDAYQLKPAQRPTAGIERLLVTLADSLAEIGDGVILDIGAKRFLDRREYRARHADLLRREAPGA
jgi:hypothetical protein